MQLKLETGHPLTANVSTDEAVTPGEVVIVGATPMVAQGRSTGVIAALSPQGGIYSGPCDDDAKEPVPGQRVELDDDEFVLASGDNPDFGICLAVNGTTALVLHAPSGIDNDSSE